MSTGIGSDLAEAIPHLREAVRLAPRVPDAHEDLGVALASIGHVDEGLPELREALRLRPNWPAAMARLALLLSAHPDPRARNVDEAIRLSTLAVKQTNEADPMSLEILAASYAAAADFRRQHAPRQR